MATSIARSRFNPGRWRLTASRPERPTTSPQNRIFTIAILKPSRMLTLLAPTPTLPRLRGGSYRCAAAKNLPPQAGEGIPTAVAAAGGGSHADTHGGEK